MRRGSLRVPGGDQRTVPARPSLEERLAAVMPLDERQRKLVALLLAGHTDASAAGRLGVSPRTVTNILRSLMDRLGVDNRFQLGVALGSRMRAPDRPDRPPRPVPIRGEIPEYGVPGPSARREAGA
ncbi:helix-turn-helix domain-containing protein [Streptomyces heilongjiangensis]|uniref:Helix-turn-helix transcriptional regulator n=1 Tax=Streptomyces heilongjiangensis TaxID=945052 RepID=A0ABW1B8W7_9ACTN|nr:helix-turn-helix transcriptional regulator [Streptomyces heilongjiangensis]MDC2950138.1 helix-turn-helix transcriptional regulator [Streptomyces heilongjiangensis]